MLFGFFVFLKYEFPFTRLIKVKEIEIEFKSSNNSSMNQVLNSMNRLDSSFDISSSKEQCYNDSKSSFTQKYEPYPPNSPMLNHNRRYDRYYHRDFDEQLKESSNDSFQSSKNSIVCFTSQNQREKSLENKRHKLTIKSSNLNLSFLPKNPFQSIRFKRNKVFLLHPSDTNNSQLTNGKQHQNQLQLPNGTLRSAGVMGNCCFFFLISFN